MAPRQRSYAHSASIRPYRPQVPKRPKAPPSAPLRRGPRVRVAISSGGTVTQLQTKRKYKPGKVAKIGDNASISYTNYGKLNKVNKQLYVKLMGHSIREAMSSSSVISTQGRQNVLNIPLLSRTDLELIKTDTNATVATENDCSMLLKTAKLCFSFKNQSNTMARCTIYDIVSINSGYTATIDTPTEAWDFGFNDMGTASQSLTIGTTPYGSPEFRKNFRITKVTKVPLEPGQQHDHVVKKKMNWFVRSTRWANTAGQNVRGLTYYCLLVWHGSLAHDNTAATSVTYTPVRIDYVTRRSYSYAYLNNNKPSYVMVDSLPTAIADLDFMGENQDADLDPINA